MGKELPRVFRTRRVLKRWFSEYLEMLKNVQQASPDYMKSEEFMSLLWEQNPISGVGQGTVDVEKVIKDKKLQQWFAQLRDKKYTDNINEELYDVYLEAMDKVIPLCDRTPRLKLNRLFAAIYPNNFGCVANYKSMKKLAKLLDVYDASQRYNPVWLNSKVNEKIDNALAQRAISLNDLVKRSIFQWFIFKHNETQTGSTDEYGQKIGQKSGDETLVFPPIERRLKGLAAIGGYSETVLRILDIARNGIRIDELKNWLKNEFPNFKLDSINAMLNVVRLQLGLLKLSPGNILEPNQIGIEYLENYDPDVLQPILLTKIIGFDRLLWRLRGNNGVSRGELVDDLQGYYKKWTSDFMPNTIINWAESFDLVNKDGSVITLTERGQQWAESIEEEPMNINSKMLKTYP